MWKSIDEAYAAAQLEAAGQGRASGMNEGPKKIKSMDVSEGNF
jgi:hypothetical protein